MIGKGYVAKSLDNTCNCRNLIRYEYAYAIKIVTDIKSRDTAAISNNYVCLSIVGTKDTIEIALRYLYVIFDFKEDLREEAEFDNVETNIVTDRLE